MSSVFWKRNCYFTDLYANAARAPPISCPTICIQIVFHAKIPVIDSPIITAGLNPHHEIAQTLSAHTMTVKPIANP